MAHDTFRDVSALPDHGFGQLGRAVHGLLADLGAAPPRPVTAMVYNTLAEPPGVPGYVVFDTPDAFWEATGGDVRRWLALTAQTLRALPTPAPEELDGGPEDPEATRLDGIAMAFLGATVRPATSSAGAALAANIAEGFYQRGDIAASPAADRVPMALAVDRDESSAFLSLQGDGPLAEYSEYQISGALVTGLSELLDAFWSQIQEIDRHRD